MSKQILIVDDERSIREVIVLALRREGFKTREARTLREARQMIRETEPDLLLLDIGLPDGSGLTLCSELRKTSTLPILFLTARSDEVDRVLGLEVGGDDYVVKPFSPRELVARVKAILRRNGDAPAKAPASIVYGPFSVDRERRKIFFHGQALELARYEFNIMALLIENPGKVFSREGLMGRLWEEPDVSLERTIDTHIKTLRAKLRSVNSEESPIVTHRAVGYSLREY